MCFSPEASFTAGAGLVVIGAASVKAARPKERVIALMPFLFGIQQAIEGVQWLFLEQGRVSLAAAYGFLFFALIFWPVYVPIAVYLIDESRRAIVGWFIAIGAVSAGLSLVGLFMHPLSVKVIGHSIDYGASLPFKIVVGASYLVAVFGPLLISRSPLFRGLGAAVFIAAVIAEMYYYATFASVWCFFAALTSVIIYGYIYYNRRLEKPVI